MDIITLTTEVKETIDLDQMSSDDLKKVVKHLWHEVQSLSSKNRIRALEAYSTIGRSNVPR